MSVQRTSHDGSDPIRSADLGTGSDYEVLTGKRTVSKSLLSKTKNLLYSLSKPFRALARQIVQHRLGDGDTSAGMANIKSTPLPRTSPSKPAADAAGDAGRGYVIISSEGGYRSPSLLDRLWG